jgi:cyclic pyranopterin phosphate synthase
MPLDTHDKNWKDKYLPLDAVKKVAEEMGHTLIHRNDIKGAGPAEIFTFYGAKGSVGLIHPVSRHFCEECNRLRLTADGFIRPCLYWEEELSVKPFLHDKSKLKELIEKALEYKRQRHAMGQNPPPHEDNLETRGMSKIGG